MEIVSVNSKGQVTIPLKIRQQLGICKGSKVAFVLFGDHVKLCLEKEPERVSDNGFGMLKSCRKAVPTGFDVASLLENSYG